MKKLSARIVTDAAKNLLVRADLNREFESKNNDGYSSRILTATYNYYVREYDFNGWYTDPECTNLVTEIGAPNTKLVTLYTPWTPGEVEYKGNVLDPEWTVEEDLPDEPFEVPEGYEFDGWEEPVLNDDGTATVTPKFTPKVYELTNEETGETETWTYGEDIPFDPEKKGYTFDGWDDVEINDIDGTATVKPNYTPNVYELTNEETGETETWTYDTPIPFDDPEKFGYSFDGWDDVAVNDADGTATVAPKFSPKTYQLTNTETGETKPWIYDTEYPFADPSKEDLKFDGWELVINKMYRNLCGRIRRMLIASCKTLKNVN